MPPRSSRQASTTKQLELKFSNTAFRLNQERNDFFLPQIPDFVRQRRWINLTPEYQRRLVWDDRRRSRFIESLLLNVPIPPIFLYEWDLSRYEVMDGQQRLNSILDFYENRYSLRGLEKWHELNGYRYNQLPETLQRGLDRRRISATVLLVNTSEDGGPDKGKVRKLVFERLNTGGQHLNHQELRNCLFSGPFNELLVSLSGTPIFTKAWGIPDRSQNIDRHGNISEELKDNALYRRMLDCELVLRFFAFRKRSNIKGAVRRMLDKCMEENKNPTDEQLTQMREDFNATIGLAVQIFGDRAFQYESKKGSWERSVPLYDGIMVAIGRLRESHARLRAARPAIKSNIGRLFEDQKAFELIVGKPNTAAALRDRLDIVQEAIERAL